MKKGSKMARPRNKVWILLFMSMWLGMAIAHEAFGADLQRAEREYTKFIEHIEKHAEYLKKEINYWEYQLTGARKIFYPEHFGIRDMVRRWISDYKHQLGKIEKDIIYLKEKRQHLQDAMLEVETGSGENAIFADSFDAYNTVWDVRDSLPTQAPHPTWTITKGSIDIDQKCGKSGLGVDLDGTWGGLGGDRNKAIGGKMVSKEIEVDQGNYLLQFDIRGNPIQKDKKNGAKYGVVGIGEKAITMGSEEGWKQIQMPFSVGGKRKIQVFFEHVGPGDWDGLYLDNVRVLKDN